MYYFRYSTHLIVRCSEPPAYILIIQDLHLEREVLLQVLDDHHQERKFNTQSLLRVTWARDIDRGNL